MFLVVIVAGILLTVIVNNEVKFSCAILVDFFHSVQ